MAILPDAAPKYNSDTTDSFPRIILVLFLAISLILFFAVGSVFIYGLIKNYTLQPPKLDELSSYTTTESLIISGTAPANAMIEISADNKSYQVASNNKGDFLLTISPIQEGEPTFHAVARKKMFFRDYASDWSNKVSTIIDRTPPAISLKTIPQTTQLSTVIIMGEVEEQAEVTAFVNGTKIEKSEVSPKEQFSLKVPLARGKNEVILEFVDRAGNTTRTLPASVTYSAEKLPTRLPDSSGNLSSAVQRNTKRLFLGLFLVLAVTTYLSSQSIVRQIQIAQESKKRYYEAG